MERGEKDAIERLKKELYSREDKHSVGNDIRSPLQSFDPVVPQEWPAQPEVAEPLRPPLAQFSERPHSGWSFAAKFLFASTLFFIVVAGVAAYRFFGGANQILSRNIDLQVIAPSLVDGGKDQTLQVIIGNRNKGALTLTDLIVDYPDGTRDPKDPSKPLLHQRSIIGTVASGAQIKTTIDALFYGQQGAQETVTVTMEYSVAGSNAVFQKKAQANFIVGSSPVTISVRSPTEAISGQPFDMDVVMQVNSAAPVQDVLLEAQYPFGFTLVSSDPVAGVGGGLWRLGTLQPGETRTIHIRGSVVAQDGDEKVFRFLSGSDSNPTDVHIAVPFLSVPQTLSIRSSFISALIALNGDTSSTVSVSPGSTVDGSITWQNNLNVPVSNLTATLSLKGESIDRSTISVSNGFYQSTDSTIVWDSQQDGDLATIPPGGTGTFHFSFATLGSNGNGAFINPSIDLDLSLSGVRNGQTDVPETVASAAKAHISLASLVVLSAAALHFSGPFANVGPMPPVSGQKTTYSVQWTVTDSSNSLANAQVSTTLPPYVEFVAAPKGTHISYDPPSRTVTWNIGDVKAGAGYSVPAVLGSFQVSFLPSDSQVGQSPVLTGSTLFTAVDRFAQVPIQAEADPPTIQLSDGPNFQENMGKVISGH